MNTKVITCMEDDDKGRLAEAGSIIRRGGLVAFPTETVYGLGGDALNPLSSQKIYEAKGRPSDNPLIVHICRFADIYRIASNAPEHQQMLEAAKRLADAFWPGPLTLILPKAEVVPFETTGGLSTVAVRFPAHRTAQALIAAAGGFVAAPSANTSGRPSPTLAKYVLEDMDGRIDMVIDGGEVGIGLESTIVDLTVEPAEILRPGYVSRDMLQEVLGRVETDKACSGGSEQAPRAPGMKYRHYAPNGDMTIVSGKKENVVEYINTQISLVRGEGKRSGVIATDETAAGYRADIVKSVGSRTDELSAARRLYAVLRELDEEGVEVIYSEAFEDDGIGEAVMNRLLKAAGHHMIQL